jgi:hypothetical protein
LKAFDRKEAQVDQRRVREPNGDEARKQWREFGAAFEHIFVEGRTLFAGKTTPRDKERFVVAFGFGESGRDVATPNDVAGRERNFRLRWAENFCPVDGGEDGCRTNQNQGKQCAIHVVEIMARRTFCH